MSTKKMQQGFAVIILSLRNCTHYRLLNGNHFILAVSDCQGLSAAGNSPAGPGTKNFQPVFLKC
jgi:hypothetical protein